MRKPSFPIRNPRFPFPLLLAAALLAFPLGAFAQITAIIDNTGSSNNSGTDLTTPERADAHAFTTDGFGWRLESIRVIINNRTAGSSTVEVKLWSGDGNAPAAVIEDLGITSIFGLGDIPIYRDSSTNPILQPNTRYWVSVRNVFGEIFWATADSALLSGSEGGDTGPATYENLFAQSSNGGGTWSGPFSGSGAHRFAVNATPFPLLVTNTDPSGDGSLRAAIAAADPGVTITFAQNLSGQTIGLGGDELIIDKDLTIDGSSLTQAVTISGENSSRVFLIGGGHLVVLDSLIISDGQAPPKENGGGVFIQAGSTLTITNSTLSANRAGESIDGASGGRGGGIYNGDGTVTVADSTLSDNHAGSGDFGGNGGGIYNGDEFGNSSGGTLTITNSTLSANRAGDGFFKGGEGGGIYNAGSSTLTIANSTISANIAGDRGDGGSGGGGGRGGGIYCLGETLTVTNSTVTGNRAGKPGVSGLVGSGGGGGMHLFSKVATISNSIIAGNQAGAPIGDGEGGEGADIYAEIYQNYDGNVEFRIVGPNLIGDNETVESVFDSISPLVGTTASPLDPMLGALADNGGPTQTMLPLAGSPALNAGDFSQRPQDTADLDGDDNTTELLPLEFDQRGFARVSGAALDLGSVERQPSDNTGGGGNSSGGGGGATSPPKDTWSVHYQKADADFAYYISIGDTNFAWAFFYFNKALGDFAFHSAYGRHAEATFWFHTWVGAYHYYYFQIIPGAEGAKAAAYQLRFWYAWAYFYYHSKRGEKDLADYWFNYWYSEALAFL